MLSVDRRSRVANDTTPDPRPPARRGDRLRTSVAYARRGLVERFASVSMRTRLIALILALVVVIVGGLGTLISLSEENSLLTAQAVALRSETRVAAQSLHREGITPAADGAALPAAAAQPPASLAPSLRFVVARLTNSYTSVTIWNAAGQMLVNSQQVEALSGQAAPSAVMPVQATLRRAWSTAPMSGDYSIARDAQGRRQLLILLPLLDAHTHTTVAMVQVSTPLQPITDAVARTHVATLAGVLLALAFAAALTVPLVSAGLRPLVALERTSRRVASGDLSVRLDEPPTQDEVGQLIRSFNSMALQLETTFQRQRQFVADVSHELRTPLTALNGELEMLMLGADGGNVEGVRRLARGMHAEIDRMRRLVEDLLTLAQFDEGQKELAMQPVDVAQLVEQVAQHGRALASGQDIETDVATDLPALRADPDRLLQALLNVLENALKYTPPDGHIRLTARLTHADVTPTLALAVSDTGAGIAPDALPRIFDRFYRADTARTRGRARSTGAGLGLSIVKSLVEAQGGVVTITSARGAGTIVTFSFPASPSADYLPQLNDTAPSP